MKKTTDILDELRNLNSDLPAALSTPYAVPEGYFEDLPAGILSKIKHSAEINNELAELAPSLLDIKNINPYSVPDNYFQENLEQLPFVFSEEKSAVLESIGKEMPYEVPAGYFASVDEQLLERVPRRGKLVSISTRWMRVAAAAILTGVIGLAGYNYYQENQQAEYTASRPDTMQQQTAVLVPDKKVENDLKKVSINELETFIKNIEMPGNATASISKAPKSGTLKEELKDISIQELDLFLNEIPTGNDELSVID